MRVSMTVFIRKNWLRLTQLMSWAAMVFYGHFYFYIGAIEPRKNFKALIQAYAMLPGHIRSAYQLLIVAQGTDAARADLQQFAISALALLPMMLLFQVLFRMMIWFRFTAFVICLYFHHYTKGLVFRFWRPCPVVLR